MEDMTLRIECAGHTTVNIDELEELHHYGKITDEHYAHARNSLTELGFSFPFFYWEQDGRKYTVDGHSRLKVLKRMRDEGYTIPPLPADPIFAKDRAEAKKKILAQESRYKDFDEGLFTEFLAEDNLVMEDLENFVDIPGLDTELWEGKEDVIEDEAPAVNESEPAVSQLGQVYQLGRHRLMCGDAAKIEDVEKLMDGQKADMVFTDPPYGVSYASKNEYLNTISRGNRIQTPIENDHMELEDTSEFVYKLFLQIKNILAPRSSYYITAPQGGDLMMMMMMMMQKAGIPLRHCLIWVKNNHVLGRTDYNYKHEPILYGWVDVHDFYGKGKYLFSTWEIDKPLKNDLHPTMKPIALMVNAIENSTKEDQIVADLCGGSGSTLIACEQTNRTCYMSEIDNRYTDVIIKRWMKFTGKRAYEIKDENGKQSYIPVVFADESFMESKTLQEDSEVLSGKYLNTAQKNAGQSEQL